LNSNQIIVKLIQDYQQLPGGLLPLLHAIQDELGYIPSEEIKTIADGFHLSRAEVHGVISFYHDFRSEPAGRHTVQICRAEACQAMGARVLEDHAKRTLGVALGETTTDRAISLEPVYCLGNCACSPSVRIDNEIHARVDKRRFDELIAALTAPGEAQ
jgi:formate dehydrogenase subunit gamma